MSITKLAAFVSIVLASSSYAQEPVPAGGTGTRLVRVYFVDGDAINAIVAEVDSESFLKVPIGEKSLLKAATYRLTADNAKCEAFESIGSATRISDTQIAVQLSRNLLSSAESIYKRVSSADEVTQNAVLFLPASFDEKAGLVGKPIDDFSAAVQPKIDEGGFIAYPDAFRPQRAAVTCTCKAFFGCTTGCCTSPTCNVILGICQSNPNCKKVDLTSNCSCRQ